MKAVVYITELSTYFPEGSTFHLRICWIIIVITQYLRHFHRSYDNYLKRFSFISPSLSTSFLVFLFFPFLFKRSSMSGVVTLLVDSKPLSVFCHMGNFGCGDGGWTPVMKINGNEVHIYFVYRPALFQNVANCKRACHICMNFVFLREGNARRTDFVQRKFQNLWCL